MRTDAKPAIAEAIKFLERRGRFAEEIRVFLRAEGHEESVVEYVVQFLLERKLINDNNTTQHLIERNSGKRSVGIERLRAELEKLGAPEEIVEANLAAISESDTERALAALRAKYKSGADRAKAGRFLHSRGFGEEAMEGALDQFCGPHSFPE